MTPEFGAQTLNPGKFVMTNDRNAIRAFQRAQQIGYQVVCGVLEHL
jgi:hypothetical protein